jgi:hypothetical protein
MPAKNDIQTTSQQLLPAQNYVLLQNDVQIPLQQLPAAHNMKLQNDVQIPYQQMSPAPKIMLVQNDVHDPYLQLPTTQNIMLVQNDVQLQKQPSPNMMHVQNTSPIASLQLSPAQAIMPLQQYTDTAVMSSQHYPIVDNSVQKTINSSLKIPSTVKENLKNVFQQAMSNANAVKPSVQSTTLPKTVALNMLPDLVKNTSNEELRSFKYPGPAVKKKRGRKRKNEITTTTTAHVQSIMQIQVVGQPQLTMQPITNQPQNLIQTSSLNNPACSQQNYQSYQPRNLTQTHNVMVANMQGPHQNPNGIQTSASNTPAYSQQNYQSNIPQDSMPTQNLMMTKMSIPNHNPNCIQTSTVNSPAYSQQLPQTIYTQIRPQQTVTPYLMPNNLQQIPGVMGYNQAVPFYYMPQNPPLESNTQYSVIPSAPTSDNSVFYASFNQNL